MPRSRELSTFALLMAAGGGLWIMGGGIAGRLSDLMKAGLKLPREFAYDPQLVLNRLSDQSYSALLAFAPFFILVMIVALVAPMLLSGWVLSAKAVQPDFSRLSLLNGIVRMFSAHGAVELVKAVAKAALIGSVAAWVIWHHKDAALSLAAEPLESGITHLGRLAALSFLSITAAMLLVVAVDVPFQIWDHHSKLKMTKEELRQEARETEGDPKMKARIRAQQREMARRRMMAEVPKADVIVTNPTHYAVALKYDDGTAGAPRVLAKGVHLLALKIRELATEHRVPVLEAPALARALYHHSEIGDEIPEKLYAAVAEVLAYVYQLRRYRQFGGAAPHMSETLPVPAELDPENPESSKQ